MRGKAFGLVMVFFVRGFGGGLVVVIPSWFAAPWIHSLHHESIFPQPMTTLQFMVKDLWLPHQKSWNESYETLIRSMFQTPQAAAILEIPLSPLVTNDEPIWSPNHIGHYSVKSAYHMAMLDLLDITQLQAEGEWHRFGSSRSLPVSNFSCGGLAENEPIVGKIWW